MAVVLSSRTRDNSHGPKAQYAGANLQQATYPPTDFTGEVTWKYMDPCIEDPQFTWGDASVEEVVGYHLAGQSCNASALAAISPARMVTTNRWVWA